MNLSKTRVVIVGAGQAGGRAAEALRAGHLGPLATARNMAGEGNDYEAPPWFWSDQYDANIQIVGHPTAALKSSGATSPMRRFTTLSIRDNEVAGGIAVNAARDMSVPHRLVASRKTIRRSDLENRILN